MSKPLPAWAEKRIQTHTKATGCPALEGGYSCCFGKSVKCGTCGKQI